jgi:hypothetical protein
VMHAAEPLETFSHAKTNVGLPSASCFREFLARFPTRRFGGHLTDLQGNRPGAPRAVPRMVRFLHRESLLVFSRNASIQAGPKHFPRPACLARNVSGFAFGETRFMGI